MPAETLRYCRSVEEIPMGKIFDRQRFMASFSQIQLVREIPPPEQPKLEVRALGLLEPSEETPVLPCSLSFSPEKTKEFGRTMLTRVGFLNDPGTHFRLEIHIRDEVADAARAVRDAFTAAAITDKPYLRIAFETEPCNPRGRLQLLLAEGFCEGPTVTRIVFGAGMTLAAPDWSWAWESQQLETPVFHDPALARFRRGQQRR